VLYDTREGALRDNVALAEVRPYLGGVMHYVELDVNNLCRWFTGAIGASGTRAYNTTGYAVYFSDRRGNKNQLNQETGEYGFEDFVNPGSANGTPNGILDTGEDVNVNGTLDVYGQVPRLPLTPTAPAAPLDGNALPWLNRVSGVDVTGTIARENKPVLFRRALKLVNGSTINLGMNGAVPFGLAVATENPLYVQGDYNSTGGDFNGAHVACSFLADAVTFLSNNWNDSRSFTSPHDPTGRPAATSWYRAAIISGKGRPFPQPGGTPKDFGTDGGVHNFFRLLEDWSANGGQTVNYRGAVVSFYYNRQAVGTYKYNANNIVYRPPTRGYNFDTEFLDPDMLPPHTPSFRDVNITGFTRLLMPTQ
jgi:hypothetical protein